MRKQSGFTLIELLLVLAIIGIISAIAIPALLGQRARAKDRTAINNVTGNLGDLAGSYDKAREAGKNATDCIASMLSVLTNANARGDKNPWNAATPAFATAIGAAANSADAAPTTKGEATFYVDVATAPTLLRGAVLCNAVQAATTTTTFRKTVALD